MNSDFENQKREKIEKSSPISPLLTSIYEWLEAVVASIVVVVLIFTFLFRVVSVDGSSMNMTLTDQDRVLVFGLFYEPQRGDVVVVTHATSQDIPIIKRVIALGGDTVRIDYMTGEVFVNDSNALPESYLFEPMQPVHDGNMIFEAKVPEGCVFVMGDNRNNSDDSRNAEIGMINARLILGKAFFRIFPFSKVGGIHSPDFNAFVETGSIP